MLANIKAKYTLAKALVLSKLQAFGLLLLGLLKKVLGERLYSIVIGYSVMGQVFVQTQSRKIQAYYDSKVDKTTPYYKPCLLYTSDAADD